MLLLTDKNRNHNNGSIEDMNIQIENKTKLEADRNQPAHCLQITTQRLMAAQSGCGAPQSAQKLLLGSLQICSTTSLLDSASPMAFLMACTHCSLDCSDSAIKLWKQASQEHGMMLN